jgi:hypothetical protein
MKSNGNLVVKCEAHLADLPTWELDDLKRRHVWAMAICPYFLLASPRSAKTVILSLAVLRCSSK